MVEHDLAKVGVASSSLVSRSSFFCRTSAFRGFVFSKICDHRAGINVIVVQQAMAWWQSGHAADCKSAYAGSIPTLASTFFRRPQPRASRVGHPHRCRTRAPRPCRRAARGSRMHAHAVRVPAFRAAGLAPRRHRADPPSCSCGCRMLHARTGPGGETGRRKGLKIPRPQGHVGSIPTPGTSVVGV